MLVEGMPSVKVSGVGVNRADAEVQERTAEPSRDRALGTEGRHCRFVGASSPSLTQASPWDACGFCGSGHCGMKQLGL